MVMVALYHFGPNHRFKVRTLSPVENVWMLLFFTDGT